MSTTHRAVDTRGHIEPAYNPFDLKTNPLSSDERALVWIVGAMIYAAVHLIF